jgi:hypothetical protein
VKGHVEDGYSLDQTTIEQSLDQERIGVRRSNTPKDFTSEIYGC